jgi:hypothetical protein
MKLHIGIDPDCQQSGVAEWYPATKKLILNKLSFFDLLGRLESLKTAGCDIHVILEAGWLNKKSNFSKWNRQGSQFTAERIAKNVGSNHQIGKLIEQMLQHLHLSYELRRPQNHKVKADYFKKLTGYQGRTSGETRDAGMLVFGK